MRGKDLRHVPSPTRQGSVHAVCAGCNTDLRRHVLGVCLCLGADDPRLRFLQAGTELDLVHVYSPEGMVSVRVNATRQQGLQLRVITYKVVCVHAEGVGWQQLGTS